MTDDTVLGNTVSELPQRQAGTALRIAREAAGLSIEEVATKLKLAPRQIAAMEAEDWVNLPERTFTRGFFYSYARLVGVDKKVVDATFTARSSALGELRTLSAGISEVTQENTSAQRPLAKWGIPIALILCLVAGTAWFIWRDVPMPQASSKLPISEAAKAAEKSQQPNAAPSNYGLTGNISDVSTNTKNEPIALLNRADINAATSALPIATPSATATLPTPPAVTQPIAATNSSPTLIPPSTNPTPTTASTPSTTTAAINAAAPAATNAPLTLKAGQKRVNVSVTGRSWMEIRGRGDLVASENLIDAAREFAVTPPIAFHFGNSSNVKLTIDGKPYDFSMHVRNEVARFRIE
jgi:cytoskeleton protein RodZ